MIYWAPFLHFYQPPTQFHAILKKVCNESYRPLLAMLGEHPNTKVTINICGVLTEMLNDHGASDILDQIKTLAQNNQIEFADSGKYHPILPLIPKKEMRRQIELNHKTNGYFFKKAYQPKGFFPPEMCYSEELAGLLSEMGYLWVLVGGIAATAKWPLDVIYNLPVKPNGLKIFYRDDIISNKISFKSVDSKGFIQQLVNLRQDKDDIYVITAMDAETFGHHIQNWERLFLEEVYEMIEGVASYRGLKQRADLALAHKNIMALKESKEVKVVTISELLNKFPSKNAQAPRPSSWSSSAEDIEQGNYYPLWKHQHNPIHDLQWQHVNVCFELLEEAARLKDNEESNHFYAIARGLLDRAIHSCQFWWANKERRTWDMNLINKGLMFQEEVVLNGYKAIYSSNASEAAINEAHYKVTASRDIASKIRDLIVE